MTDTDTTPELEKFEQAREGMIHARVSRSVRTKFRNMCEDAGSTMRDRVKELMEMVLERDHLPEPKHKEKEVVLFIRSLPPELKQQFKAFCNIHYLSLEDGLVSLLELDLEGKFQ